MSDKQTWFCAQLGRKDHYAVPRALHAAGVLGGFLTDFWAGRITKEMAGLLPGKLWHTVGARYRPDIPSNLVESWNLRACLWEACLRRRARSGGVEGLYLGFCEVGRRFAQAVRRNMMDRRSLPANSVFYGYDTASLEVMEHLKERGVKCVLYQIDPCQVEVETVQAEQRAWPGWEDHLLDVPEEFFARHRNEWAVADHVIVSSEFARQGLMQQGVSGAKLKVIPLSFEVPRTGHGGDPQGMEPLRRKMAQGFSRENPLRVLFLGQVMLRKGIQYLVQAAESLQGCPVVFDIVGPLRISAKAVSSAPPNVVFHGRVTSDTIIGWYRSAHVFVLPTLSDSFAITQIEAMANGLPVIATPNCGAVVSDGVDGFIVPPRDPQALARVIRCYLADPNCLANQQQAALQKSKQFTLERFGASLLKLGQQLPSL